MSDWWSRNSQFYIPVCSSFSNCYNTKIEQRVIKKSLVLLIPALNLWRCCSVQTVAYDGIVEVKSPCHCRIANVSKLNLASLLELYYQVCLALSQILMKSSMNETILYLLVFVWLSLRVCVCVSVLFEICCSISRDYMCMHAHCLNIHGSWCDCWDEEKKTTTKNHGLYISWLPLFFSISFCAFMANSLFQSDYFFFVVALFGKYESGERAMVSFTRFLLLTWHSTSYITNLNPFYVCFCPFFFLQKIFIFGIANWEHASLPLPRLLLLLLLLWMPLYITHIMCAFNAS